MCQMCDEYEAELIRMGLIEEARTAHRERHDQQPAAEEMPREEASSAATSTD